MTNTLGVGTAELRYFDLAAAARRAGRNIASYPFVIRVLIENLERHRAWGADVSDAELDALWNWQTHENTGLPLRAERVILPDSSGVPVMQDLAALRNAVAANGGDASQVNTRIPLDLVVDHSLQVDNFGSPLAMAQNMRRELERNGERYSFLKWAQQAFRGLRVFPPGTGIIHQINLETIAPVVARRMRPDGEWAFPDFVIGGDSHTPMINALGVLGWGVGGIDATAALLGQAYTFPVPAVVGVHLSGEIRAGTMTTDVALMINKILRDAAVTGGMVEFFGPAVAGMPVAERATIANMAPEYGATCGFFPVDEQTIRYLTDTGRDPEQIELVVAYCRANALWRDSGTTTPTYSRVIEIDLSRASPGMAGPRRPHDWLALNDVGADFVDRIGKPPADGGFGSPAEGQPPSPEAGAVRDGTVVLAAITSCTNTSNPAVMIAAGLVAEKAVALGLTTPPWVKTSLAPGSRVVTRYLEQAGLLEPLADLGFALIGYGCTTCGGKSGPLIPEVAAGLEGSDAVAVAVLSGNRNFEGRIHKLIRANYIGSPPMVVVYALAGRIDIDFDAEPVGNARDGRPVYLRDLWPSPESIRALLPLTVDKGIWASVYDPAAMESQSWLDLPATSGSHFAWDAASSYLVEPPFFKTTAAGGLARLAKSLASSRVLAAFGDSLTTDHISPGGEIPPETPAGQYLESLGVKPRDFNSYVSRRGNFEVMKRATFANIRLRNLLVPGIEGGFTRHFPDGERMTIFDAAGAYADEEQTLIVLGGKDYGTGSSRDWAAKGSALLGVKAVIAESFERIHRANLVGMGVLPLRFAAGEGWRQLGLTGEEVFAFGGVEAGVLDAVALSVTARAGERCIRFEVFAELLTAAERQLMMAGGIPASVLDHFLTGAGSIEERRTH